MILAFHPNLDIERIVIFHSFQQKQDRLFVLSHFKNQMLQFVDPITLNQLKDTCLKVCNKENSFALSEMFSIELKFTIGLLIKWFYQTCKSRFLETDALIKQKYQKNNLIDWTETKCCICDFKLNLDLAYGSHSDEMTYLDFVIRKEHLFLINLSDKDLISTFKEARDLPSYHKNFIRMTKCVRLLCEYYSMESDVKNIDHDCLEYFLREDLSEELNSFEEL